MAEALKLADLVPNAQLKHYVIMEHIADGGMGHVYRAFEPALQREVAIKVLKPELAANSSQIQFFEEEAQRIAALRHPNIVPIYYIGQSGELSFFVMAFIAGHSTLDNWVEANTPLPADDALWVLQQAIEALDWALKSNIIHLDIKPSNFLVDNSGTILLTDFGLSRTLAGGNSENASSDCYGTPAYMSPEQILKNSTDQRSDIYSLGATMYHLLTMQFLHDGDTLEDILIGHVKKPFPYEQARAAGLSQGWINLLDRMTQKDPSQRFQNYDDLRKSLENIDRIPPVENQPQQESVILVQPVPHRSGAKKEELFGLLSKNASTWASSGIDSGFRKTKTQILELIHKPIQPLSITKFAKATIELQQGSTSDVSELIDAVKLLPEIENFTTSLAKTRLCNPEQAPITSAKDAVEKIGPTLTQEIVLTHVILKNDRPQSREFNWTPLLQHSISVGIISALLVDFLNPDDTPKTFAQKTAHFISNAKTSKTRRLAYCAGLLHDLGIFALGEVAPYALYATIRMAIEAQHPLQLVEREILGTDHQEIGAATVADIPLDSSIKEALLNHHDITSKTPLLNAVVFSANLLAKRQGLGFSGSPVTETLDIPSTPAWSILTKHSSKPNLAAEDFEKNFCQLAAEIPLLPLAG